MFAIENENEILGRLEAIDIENDEYEFWDANGAGISIQVLKRTAIISPARPGSRPLSEAFAEYVERQSLSLPKEDLSPIEIWAKLQREIQTRTHKRGWFWG